MQAIAGEGAVYLGINGEDGQVKAAVGLMRTIEDEPVTQVWRGSEQTCCQGTGLVIDCERHSLRCLRSPVDTW